MNHMSEAGYNEKELERAISYLTAKFTESGTNPKPVIVHSLRVAEMLWNRGASESTVISAILHDILEDTAVTYDELLAEFGKSVADTVISLTHEKIGSYEEKLEYSLDSYQRSQDLSLEALAIRACDLVDNSFYYRDAQDEAQKQFLFAKFTGFMRIAKDQLKETDYWDAISEAYELRVKNLVNFAEANA